MGHMRTIKELREDLADAERFSTAKVVALDVPELRALLDVVEAVAGLREAANDGWRCALCDAGVNDGSNMEPHEPNCAWVLARTLCGLEARE